jgi:hypothetical protein
MLFLTFSNCAMELEQDKQDDFISFNNQTDTDIYCIILTNKSVRFNTDAFSHPYNIDLDPSKKNPDNYNVVRTLARSFTSIPMSNLIHLWENNPDTTSSYAKTMKMDLIERGKFLPFATVTFLRKFSGNSDLLQAVLDIGSETLNVDKYCKTHTFDLTKITERIEYILTIAKNTAKIQQNFDKTTFELEKRSNKEKISFLEEKQQIEQKIREEKTISETVRFLALITRYTEIADIQLLLSMQRH